MSRAPNGLLHAAVFGIDRRAIVALRILLGLLVLASLADRLRDFTAFYTDVGVLSQAEAWDGHWFVPWDGPSHLHPFWLPDPWSSIVLFAVAAVAAMLLVFGRQPKAAAFLAWLMLTGIDNRNPLVINAGDDLLRLLLFWSLFLPLSAKWSEEDHRVVGVGTAAFVVQLALVYFTSASFKSYRSWVSDGDALHYALHLEQFVTPLGIALRDHLPMRLLSQTSWWLERIGPLLIFSPFATDGLRYLLFIAFAGLHLGIDLTLGVGLFSYACIVAWVVILPSGFWQRVDRRVISARRPGNGANVRSAPSPLVARLLCGFFAAYVLAWNVWSLNPARHDTWFPRGARRLGYELRLGQLWAMFSPAPSDESDWLELGAQTSDGVIHWLRPDGLPCDELPATPQGFLTERWRKLHERILEQQGSPLGERYAEFLLRRFDRSPGGVPAKVTITWVKKRSPPLVSSGRSELPEVARPIASAGLDLDRPIPRRPAGAAARR